MRCVCTGRSDSEAGVLTCTGRWSSWPCRTAGWRIHGSSETVDPATWHTPPPLSAATKRNFFSLFQVYDRDDSLRFSLFLFMVFAVVASECHVPAGHELSLQRRAKESQRAPWDIWPRVAPPPPSYSRTFLCHESAHLTERERERGRLFRRPGLLFVLQGTF